MTPRKKRTIYATHAASALTAAVGILAIVAGTISDVKFVPRGQFLILLGLVVFMIACIAGVFSIQVGAIWRNLYWLASLASKGGDKTDLDNQIPHGERWPWGSHHTEMLGHLDAAAQTFWVRYDPTDPSTAPTNEMVSRWLRDERSVSKEKADAIASILRADGLRPGPRR